ncbi:hypothetical protein P8452_48931 [Trifolium repens]|nr:hypothetical protein P8452_48931 [Trifolium repens]
MRHQPQPRYHQPPPPPHHSTSNHQRNQTPATPTRLIIAAARFFDLPELRYLRQIFQERYRNSLECFFNQEFAANLNPKSFTLEQKVRLMQEISSEFSIKWDCKAFELRMPKPSVFAQGHNTFKSDH